MISVVEKALAVMRWQPRQWQTVSIHGASPRRKRTRVQRQPPSIGKWGMGMARSFHGALVRERTGGQGGRNGSPHPEARGNTKLTTMREGRSMLRALALVPLLALLAGCIDIPQAPKHQTVRRSTASFAVRPEGRECLSNLGATQANFTPLPDQYFGAGCSTVNTVRLASLQGDYAALALSNLGPVTCPLANTFAGWARFGVDRAARQILGSPLVRIETMGSYNCRNVAGSERRSAHATANAIDVSAFVLADGRRISVLADWNDGTLAERQFLQIVHASACKRFGTVLGPNYNPAHQNHFHVELSGSHFCR
jgi:hypothetical protein